MNIIKDRPWLPLLTIIVVVLFVAGLVIWSIMHRAISLPAITTEKTTINHSLVVEKVQAVAKLVSSESTLRDVVTYENTWYGSTKRSLVVVTGKILTGIDLSAGSDVQIDDATRRIKITLPRATVIAIDLIDLKTYNEEGGLWNPFQPSDRDNIYKLARAQFEQAARDTRATEHAEQSAKQLLETLFTTNGYQAEVIFQAPPLLRK